MRTHLHILYVLCVLGPFNFFMNFGDTKLFFPDSKIVKMITVRFYAYIKNLKKVASRFINKTCLINRYIWCMFVVIYKIIIVLFKNFQPFLLNYRVFHRKLFHKHLLFI